MSQQNLASIDEIPQKYIYFYPIYEYTFEAYSVIEIYLNDKHKLGSSFAKGYHLQPTVH